MARQALITLLTFLLCSSVEIQAGALGQCQQTSRHDEMQNSHPSTKGERNDFDKFKRDLQMFIVREAGLTEREARVFFPIYFEMKEKLRNIGHQRGRAIRKAVEENMNERDCQRVFNELVSLDKKSQRIETQYMERLKKIVGARKYLKVIDADRRFGRKVLKKMTDKKP